ncbi:DHA2 family efflux MFS transporter permease subunit [Corynebacterium sp. 335C]
MTSEQNTPSGPHGAGDGAAGRAADRAASGQAADRAASGRAAACPADAPAYPPERQAWFALVPVLMASFMNLLDQSIVAVATPDIMGEFDTGYAAVIWVTSAYLLGYAVPLLVTGRLGDQFGQNRIFLAGVATFTAASVACALSPSIWVLIVARFVQGLGASMIGPQTLSIITRVFPPERRGKAMGWWGGTAGLATLSGPILGGFLTSAGGWQWIFWVNVPLGLICLVLAVKFIPDLPATSRSFDVPGIVTSILAMTCVVVGVQQGEPAGWAPWTWGLILAGVAFGVLFVRLQATAPDRGVEALVPLGLFRSRNFSRGAGSVAVMGFVTAANAVPIMLYLQQVEHHDAFVAGLMIAPMAAVSGLMSPWVGTLIGRLHPRAMNGIGFGAMFIGHIVLFIVMRPGMPVWTIPVASILLGIGHCFFWSSNSTITMMSVPHRLTGAGSGVYNASRQAGAVLGSATTAAFLQVGAGAGGGAAVFAHALLAYAVVLVAGFLVGQGLRRPAEWRAR